MTFPLDAIIAGYNSMEEYVERAIPQTKRAKEADGQAPVERSEVREDDQDMQRMWKVGSLRVGAFPLPYP